MSHNNDCATIFQATASAWISPVLIALVSFMNTGRAMAQDKPQLLISLTSTAPDVALSELALRPNAEQPVHFFVKNPTKKDGKFTVVVGGVQAEVAVGADKTERVIFAKPAPAPAPAAPAPAVVGAAPPPEPKTPWIDVKESPPAIAVQLLQAGEVIESGKLPILMSLPHTYVAPPVLNFTVGSAPGDNELSAKVKATAAFNPPPPCVVEMVIPEQKLRGVLLPLSRDADMRGVLTKKNDEVTLFARNIRFQKDATSASAVIYISVDGYQHAFVYDLDFSKSNTTITPRAKGTSYRVVAAPVAPAGDKIPVRIEIDDSDAKLNEPLELALGIFENNRFEKKVVKYLSGDRERNVRFSPTGPDGSLLFQIQVKDWDTTVDTAGVLGIRYLRVRPKSRADEPTALDDLTKVVIDSTPPEGVKIVEAPETAMLGRKVNLKATGDDPESDIREVLFFLGKPPADGKVPPTVDIVAASGPNAKKQYSATVAMPVDKKGPTLVTVQFVNNAGMSTFASATINVLDPNDPKTAGPGRIAGKVFEGDRPQAGIEVVLFDDKGKDKDTTKTKEDGSYAFEDVPPGKYSVGTAKEASITKAAAPAKVVADKTTTVDLKLFR
jgi:hypothetical protein